MKLLYKYFLGFLLATFVFTSCDNWLEDKVDSPTDLINTVKTEDYYKRLREYKKSDHQVAFGWFGNWTGTGASYENSLKGLPDSVDFVSLWGNWKNPSQEMINDLRFVQQKKHTRALACFLVLDIGDQITPPMPKEEMENGTSPSEWKQKYWDWDDYDLEKKLVAVEKYANAICDTIYKYDYDGFDLDAEPTLNHPFETNKELWKDNKKVMERFVQTMSKRIGPKSGSGKMFVVDGEPDALPDTLFHNFDYIILQTYSTYFMQNEDKLNEKFAKQYEHFKKVATVEEIARKLIICEDFETFAKTGGAEYRLPDGSKTNSLRGFAYWNPTVDGVQYAKGGVGTFHMEYEYKVSAQGNDTYPAIRQAIQIQNPSNRK